MSVMCPIDGKDDAIQKVSATARGRIQTTDFDGYTVSSVTTLSAPFQPPVQPIKPTRSKLSWWYWVILVLSIIYGILPLFFISVLGILSMFSSDTAGAGWERYLLGIPGLCLLIFVLIFIARLNLKPKLSRYEQDMKIWDAKMQRWNRLYYCNKHDVVFDPDTGKNFTPEQLGLYLESGAVF